MLIIASIRLQLYLTFGTNSKSGVMRKDTWNTVNDVTYSDVSIIRAGVADRTTCEGKIRFSKQYMDNYQYNQKLNVIIHETVHDLRLAHCNKSDSVMQEYVTSITILSRGDQLNYDWAYNNYY